MRGFDRGPDCTVVIGDETWHKCRAALRDGTLWIVGYRSHYPDAPTPPNSTKVSLLWTGAAQVEPVRHERHTWSVIVDGATVGSIVRVGGCGCTDAVRNWRVPR